MKSLQIYSALGRSGLRVSPFSLGTMTFGTEWGFGSPEETARAIFRRYVEAGGNFIDTADGYTGGASETMVGKFTREMNQRDELVIATKYTFNANQPGNPNTGGNGRKNLMRAVEGSLKRLNTDYIDLFWVHAWDKVTPVEEVMSGLDALVRSGKVRYIGLSNVPGWYVGRAQTLAELRGWEKVCAIQYEYSLLERGIEREFVPAAIELGMGITPWSPLAGGMLTGKYKREGASGSGEGRVVTTKDSGNPAFKSFSERNWAIIETLVDVAKKMDKPPAQVALNWVVNRPGITSTILGATKLAQLDDNLASLDFAIPAELAKKLDEVSKPEAQYPYLFFGEELQGLIHGGSTVRKEPASYRPR